MEHKILSITAFISCESCIFAQSTILVEQGKESKYKRSWLKKDAIKIFEDKKLCAVTSYTIHGLKIQ